MPSPSRTRGRQSTEEKLAAALDAMTVARQWAEKEIVNVTYLLSTLFAMSGALSPAKNPKLQGLAGVAPGQGGPDIDGMANQVVEALARDGEDLLWSAVLHRAAAALQARARAGNPSRPRPRPVKDPRAPSVTKGRL